MGNKIMLAVLLLCLKMGAQEAWSLKQCIAYGLQHHRNNTIYANEKLAADAMAREALAAYLPNIGITASFDNNIRLQQTVIPANVFGPEAIRGSLGQRYGTDAVIEVNQVLYDQSILTGLKANRYLGQQADLTLEQAQEAIIYNISIAYFQILVYTQQLRLLGYNNETYARQQDIYRLQVEKGVALQKDLDKVTVDFNNTASQIRVAQSNLRLAENQLKYEMGYPINEPILLHIADEIALPPLPQGAEDTFSPSARTDYRISELNIKVLETEQSRIRAEALPKLSAYFRYGAVSFSDHFKDSYDDMLPYSTVGLKLSIPVFDFFRRGAQYRQASINTANAGESLTLAGRKYIMEYENARTRLLQAEISIENDKRNVILAESVLSITDLQFRKGTTDLTDWLNTQYALKEAQNNYLGSLYLHYQARADFEKAAGTLKNFYNSLDR
ncbi:TolC family protein [Flavobacterium sp. MFBS3-15]|uniref:TolC family protein n=1 Tax=Flavobacterium sp. MFBS3-15 TaxID=2989816 RepID=UPI0022365B9E|nr:TolC family protein [Flavobacterium sp. MFBS3-15]MCW4467619.1 TolC family protein [Flavobacterium sp. MFBS3-15]